MSFKLSASPDSWRPQFSSLCKDEKSSCEVCHQAVGIFCLLLSELCNKDYNCVNPSSMPLCCTNKPALGWLWLPVCMWYLSPCLLSLLLVNRVKDLVIVQYVSGKNSYETAMSSASTPRLLPRAEQLDLL